MPLHDPHKPHVVWASFTQAYRRAKTDVNYYIMLIAHTGFKIDLLLCRKNFSEVKFASRTLLRPHRAVLYFHMRTSTPPVQKMIVDCCALRALFMKRDS